MKPFPQKEQQLQHYMAVLGVLVIVIIKSYEHAFHYQVVFIRLTWAIYKTFVQFRELAEFYLKHLFEQASQKKKEKNVFRSCSPGPSHSFVVVLRVHGQYGDPRANVDQQHGEGVVQGTGLFHAALGVWWVLEVVALWVSIEAHPVNVQQAVDQAIQLIELQQLQVGHLQHKWRRVKMLRGHYFIW